MQNSKYYLQNGEGATDLFNILSNKKIKPTVNYCFNLIFWHNYKY